MEAAQQTHSTSRPSSSAASAERDPLPVIALTTDTSVLTAVGNDYGFEEIFVRQVRALASPGDAVVAISTSGRSPNVLQAVGAARAAGATTIALTGGDGGELAKVSDIGIVGAFQQYTAEFRRYTSPFCIS